MKVKHYSNRDNAFVDQRYFFLETDLTPKTASAPVTSVPAVINNKNLDIPSQIFLKIDPKGKLKIYIHLNETDAQEIAGTIKSGNKMNLVMKSIIKIVKSGIESLKRFKNNITIVKAGKVQSEEFVAGIMGKVGDALIGWVVDKVMNYIWDSIEKWLATKAKEFIAATENPARGVTIILTYSNISIPNFNLNINSIWKSAKSVLSTAVPAVKYIPDEIKIVPGLRNGK